MLKALRNIFSPPNPFRFEEVQSSDLSKYPNGLNDIYERKMDGFLIKGVLDPNEVNTLLKRLNEVSEEEIIKVKAGLSMYPPTFSQFAAKVVNPDQDPNDYFLESQQYQDQFPERMGVDFKTKLHGVLDQMAGGKRLIPTPGLGNQGSFVPFNFRMLPAGPGELKTHCENLFHGEFPQFFKELEKTAKVKNQLSFFVMLQPAEVGGELCLFDLIWDNVQTRLPGDTILIGTDGKKYDLTQTRKVRQINIAPQAGDMVVFGGGQIWHRVNFVKGNRSRITLGGFLSQSRDNTSVFYWT